MDRKESIGFVFKDMSNLLKRELDHRMGCDEECQNRTGDQGFLIGYICEHSLQGNVFQRDIEREFHIRRSSATGSLNILEKNGYIKRKAVKEDARLKKIEPTKKAKDKYEKISSVIKEFDEDICQGICQEDIDAFYRVVHQIKHNINKESEKGTPC